MNKVAALIIVGCSLALSGCVMTENYRLYAETQQAIAESNARAEMARVQALSEIAKNGDTTAQVAALITLNLGGQERDREVQLAEPESVSDQALKWTAVLLPSLTQIYGINKSIDLAKLQSNNSRDVAINNNNSMVNMGRLIADQEIPVIGSGEDRLIYPEPTIITGTDSAGGDIVLYPRD